LLWPFTDSQKEGKQVSKKPEGNRQSSQLPHKEIRMRTIDIVGSYNRMHVEFIEQLEQHATAQRIKAEALTERANAITRFKVWVNEKLSSLRHKFQTQVYAAHKDADAALEAASKIKQRLI
jgi:uncharacterized protein YgbK (DUF1537 family)